MIVNTLHNASSNILCIFLPDFQVGGRNRYNPEISDNKSFTSPSTLFSQRGFIFTGEGRGSLTPILDLNAFNRCVPFNRFKLLSGMCIWNVQ